MEKLLLNILSAIVCLVPVVVEGAVQSHASVTGQDGELQHTHASHHSCHQHHQHHQPKQVSAVDKGKQNYKLMKRHQSNTLHFILTTNMKQNLMISVVYKYYINPQIISM